MQDTITNAHRLIGENIREPGEARCGRIVGVDQYRAQPVIFVIWQGQEGIHRFELTFDELGQLAEACIERQDRGARRESTVDQHDDADASRTFSRRRVGSR
ncbi:hypothetical protein [Salinicola avicenniae]|uniref:hypothetical protein n=1 Tax=Salinicola avicenniae TaxID=2916836 RepID=UPI002072D6E9|nr:MULTISPECIES: hypothetical protein [unclassified Salinicola]